MSNHVLTSRIYFPDAATAENAHAHLVALAQHGAAVAVQVGEQLDTSWARVHECHADDANGSTSLCRTTLSWVGNAQEPGEEAILWAPDQTVAVDDLREYEGVVYRCLQAHTTQAGWEPPSVPALWEVT